MKFRYPDFRFLQFAKAPATNLKTRLAGALDLDQRIELHCAMTQYMARTIIDSQLAPLQLWVEGDSTHELFTSLPPQVEFFSQQGVDLGERLLNAFTSALNSNAGVIVVGSDCPFIDATYLEQALIGLQSADAVVGPAQDGGYVLLGLRQGLGKAEEEIFQGIDWGSERVLDQTLAKLTARGAEFQLLPALGDIDRPEDLKLLDSSALPRALQQFAAFSPANSPS